MLDHARPDLDQARSDRRGLALRKRARLGDRGAHAMHQPERGGVEGEPHLIGGRALTRHAIRRQLRLVQLDQVLHLPALAMDVLIKLLRRALERGHDVMDVDLLAHRSLRAAASIPAEPRPCAAASKLPAWYTKLASMRSFAHRI